MRPRRRRTTGARIARPGDGGRPAPGLVALLVVGCGLLMAAVLLAAPRRSAAQTRIDLFPDVPVTAEDLRVQPANNSPQIVADPTEARFVVIANRLDNPDFGCALQVSGDGGRRWLPASPVPELPPGADKCYQPAVAFDARGTLYYLFVGLAGRGNEPIGAFLTTSRDRGRTFTPPVRVLGPGNYMVRLAVDPDRGERGRLHLVWLRTTLDSPLGGLPPPPNPIMAAHSDDGGRTFSEPVQVSDPRRARVVAPAVALGPDGAVHVLYYDLKDDVIDYQGLEGPPWPGTWALVLSTSRDAGRSFREHVLVDDELVPPERVLLIYTMPPPALAADRRGTVYAAWHDGRNEDWDVFLRRSHDGGRAWAPPVRVNDDEVGNGRHQSMPALAVAPGGRLDAIFYDRRADPENVFMDVYYAFSSDRGGTFSPNVRLSSVPSDSRAGTTYPIPSARGLHEFGSRIGLHSEEARVLAAWTDTRNSASTFQQAVFATEVRFPPEGGSPLLVPAVVLGVAVAGLAAGLALRRGRSGRRTARDS